MIKAILSRFLSLPSQVLIGFLVVIALLSVATPAFAATNFTWETLSNMPTGRLEGTGVTTGNKVYLFGGINSSGYVAPVSEYTVSTGVWTTKSSIPTVRRAPASALGPDGKVYVVGGSSTSGQELGTLEIYDPLTDTWTTGASMPTARLALAAVFGSNGRLYAIGGIVDDANATATGTVEEYDPTTNTWTTKQSLNYARYGHGAVKASNGLIYVAGGSPQYGVEVYDVSTNTWTLKAVPLDGHLYGSLVAASNGRLYLIGYSNTVDEYNPTNDTWTRTTGTMPVAGYRYPSIQANDGYIYRFGGQDTFSSGNTDVKVIRATIDSPDLSITMIDSPDPVIIRKPLTYSITISNNGAINANDVVVTDTIPNNTKFVSVSASQGSCNGTINLTCNLNTVNNGSTATVTIVIKPTATGILSNTANVNESEPDSDTTNNTTTVTTTVTR
jgi:uncharacterized repeat protein (TIGR01451 family)